MVRMLVVLGFVLAHTLVLMSPVAAQQCLTAPGAVVQLVGTPHLFVVDEQGILHWGGDTRGLSGHYIDWSNRCEVELNVLQQARRGDPWLSSGLPKIGNPIFLSKWEDDEAEPTLLHIQSIADVELFGINATNYGNFIIEGPVWSQRYGFQIGLLEMGPLASAESFAWAPPDRDAYAQLLRNMENILSAQLFQAHQAGIPPSNALPPIVDCEREGLAVFEGSHSASRAFATTQECLARLSFAGPSQTVPSAPTNVRIGVVDATAVDVTWDGVANAIGYRIYGGDQLGPSATLVAMVNATTTTHRVTNLAQNRTYCYAVATMGQRGESPMSQPVCATTSTGSGSAPVLLGLSRAMTDSGLVGLRVDWVDRSNNEIAFQIWRGEQMIATVGSNTTSYVDPSWQPDTSICYWVIAVTPSGQEMSQPSCIGSAGLWPPAPSGLSLTDLGRAGVQLNWTDVSATEQGFRVLRNGQTVATLNPNVTTYTDFPPADFSGITGRQTCYHVIAFNGAGETSSNQACRTR
jgi:fibronectin type 3 domain-containing protein